MAKKMPGCSEAEAAEQSGEHGLPCGLVPTVPLLFGFVRRPDFHMVPEPFSILLWDFRPLDEPSRIAKQLHFWLCILHVVHLLSE
jgi:hypothetical protein